MLTMQAFHVQAKIHWQGLQAAGLSGYSTVKTDQLVFQKCFFMIITVPMEHLSMETKTCPQSVSISALTLKGGEARLIQTAFCLVTSFNSSHCEEISGYFINKTKWIYGQACYVHRCRKGQMINSLWLNLSQ